MAVQPKDPNSRQVGGGHYKKGIQHWDYVLSKNMPYLEAVAIKYIERHLEKNGEEDLNKAIHYIEKMKAHYYPPKKRNRK